MDILYNNKVTGCEPNIIRDLLAEMMDCIKAWNYLSEQEEYEFRLILNELIANSAIHGNKKLCDKAIIVSIESIDDRTIYITIQDEGEGFNYQKIFDGIYPCDQKPYSDRGRGLKIVMAMCDEITFNNLGNGVKIRKTVYSSF